MSFSNVYKVSYMYITPKIGQNIYHGPIIYKIQKKTLSSFALKNQ